MKPVEINNIDGNCLFKVGPGHPFVLIAGPCVIESAALARETAARLKAIAENLSVPLVFKSSYDKANRTSLDSFRGPGIEEGLKILADIRREFDIPVISDVHDASQVDLAAEVLDIIQIPAFLCRQTDLLIAAAETKKPINLKKGQFMSPWDMENAVRKMKSTGNTSIILTERGFMLGYNNMVVDMRSFPVLRSLGCPVVYDATHSVQLPGGAGTSSGGQREFIPPLTRAAVAAGVDGLFMEVHPDPDHALCDGPNSLPLDQVEPLLKVLLRIHKALKEENEQ